MRNESRKINDIFRFENLKIPAGLLYQLKKFPPKFSLCLFLFFLLILLSGAKKKSSSGNKALKTEIRSYSYSRKTRGYYEIRGARTIKREYDKKGRIIKSSIYTKGNRLYETTRFIYKEGKCKEKKTYDRNNKLLIQTRYKSESGGLCEYIYNDKNELAWYYLYICDSYGRLKEKRKYAENKKIKQKHCYYYNDSGLPCARILYASDNTPIHLSSYEYEKFNTRGSWTLRKEYQSYADVNSYPKEVLERKVSKSEKLIKNKQTQIKWPSFSVNAFLNMTAKRARAKTPGGRVLGVALKHIKKKTIIRGSCYDWINMVYKECGYKGKKRKSIFSGKEAGPYANAMLLRPGDWIMFKNLTYGNIGHSGIFLGWLDFEKRSAIVIGYAGQKRVMPGRFREYEITGLFGITRGKD